MMIKTITGRGFIKDLGGVIVAKTEFGVNTSHELREGYSYTEASDVELAAWNPPEKALSRAEIINTLINRKTRKLAAEALLAEGSITLPEFAKIMEAV